MGYWLVVAMIAVAIAAVVAALAADESAKPVRRRSRDPSHGAVWVALGASDASGDGTPNPTLDNWVTRLAGTLPAGVMVQNVGVSGSRLADARRDQLPRALAASPDVVSFWLVVNDLLSGVPLPAYERDLAAVLDALATTECRVVLGNVPDLTRVPAFGAAAEQATLLRLTAQHWNAAIVRVAAAHGADVVDLFEADLDASARGDLFGPDGFHPSPAGHALLAELFRPAVERALLEADESP